MSPLPDDWPIARYRLLGEAQPGRRMRYYRAIDDDTGDVVLIKCARKSELGPAAVQSFLTEGRAVARLTHEGILRVLDVGDGGDFVFHAYELDVLRPLAERVTTRGPIAPALVVMEGVARALAFLHARGLGHGLVHTSNVVVGASLQAKLIGFSFGWEGTPGFSVGFSPPEHIDRVLGARVVVDEPRADVYMWGATLWALLLGHSYVDVDVAGGLDVGALALFHARPPPPDLGLHRDDVPRWLRRLVARCLAKDPALRPRDADELVLELEGRVEPPGTAPVRTALAALPSTTTWARPLPAIFADLATLRSPALATLRLLDLAEAVTKLLATTSLALAGASSSLPLRPSLGHWCAALRMHHGALPGALPKRVLRALDDAVAVRNTIRGHGALGEEAGYLRVLEEHALPLLEAIADATILGRLQVGEGGVVVDGTALDTSGLLVFHGCDVCGAREPLFFNAGDEKKTSWLSYETGHLSHTRS
ncbi:MAG: hypothetical protein Q8O67_18875 [Deltaproteobacteria bacterium]|nr:hypothetical protein [Deltaproteobacteria bacterium]